ncbi:MAG: prepilin-type N-terminal cleavage/methylation domain-containing protein [Desulfamplus sp.]|nr:prepilin-type N-terminal cleavage/methylation domain-containing protein [Desulfamplus sp.]
MAQLQPIQLQHLLKEMIKEMSGKNRYGSGFTLIEVVVSMVLVSMITLIASFALKINLEAWERGVNEGDKVQIEVVLSNMLERQLRYIAISAPFGESETLMADNLESRTSIVSKPLLSETNMIQQIGAVTELKLIADEKSLSFYTLYSPQGSPYHGLTHVNYIYDESAKELTIYQKVIRGVEDISDITNQGSKRSKRISKRGSANDNVPLSTIRDVEQFSLSFIDGEDVTLFNSSASKRSTKGFSDSSSLKKSWAEDSLKPPAYIRLLFAQTKRKGGEPSVWLFKVGGVI